MINVVQGWSTGYTLSRQELKNPVNQIFKAIVFNNFSDLFLPQDRRIQMAFIISCVALDSLVDFGKAGSLGGNIKKVSCFLSDHWDELSQGAVAAGSVALIVRGNASYGSAVLAGLAYNQLDRKGYIDARISKFVSAYMPWAISLWTLAAGPTIALRFIASVDLIGRTMSLSIYKTDYVLRKLLGIARFPLLQEFEAPLTVKKELTAEEIKEIAASPDGFEPNPAFCTKSPADVVKLPASRSFSQFLALFNQIKWDKYADVMKRLCPEELEGESLVQWYGLRVAIVTSGCKESESSARLLYFLPKLKEDLQAEVLMNLAVEGGTPEKNEAAAKKMLDMVLMKCSEAIEDPFERIQMKIFFALQKKRQELISSYPLSERKMLSLGFYEKGNDLAAADIIQWNMSSGLNRIYNVYCRSFFLTAALAVTRKDYQNYRKPIHDKLSNDQLFQLMLFQLGAIRKKSGSQL